MIDQHFRLDQHPGPLTPPSALSPHDAITAACLLLSSAFRALGTDADNRHARVDLGQALTSARRAQRYTVGAAR